MLIEKWKKNRTCLKINSGIGFSLSMSQREKKREKVSYKLFTLSAFIRSSRGWWFKLRTTVLYHRIRVIYSLLKNVISLSSYTEKQCRSYFFFPLSGNFSLLHIGEKLQIISFEVLGQKCKWEICFKKPFTPF